MGRGKGSEWVEKEVKMSYLGESIKKLGFGLMRLPMNGEEIDMAQTKEMVDRYMADGFTYFDTAYVYINGKSEVALKEAVVDRYPRDAFQAATKLPMHAIQNKEDMEKIFQESCTRAGLDFYDFYLLHGLGKDSYQKTKDVGAWDYLRTLKAQGRIRHMGLSFHDSAEVLEKILSEQPDTEFVQLQINYVDWEDDGVQARKCYEVARAHDVPIIVMEPVKGGSLALMRPEVREIFKKENPDASVASWAMRYAASMEGIITVLSGMSNMAQMEDNCQVMKDFQPLNEGERAVVEKVVTALKEIPTIPCTTCKYCVDDCPQQINIPGILSVRNNLTVYGDEAGAKRSYGFAAKDGGKASDCIACGVCESRCPQHIDIIEQLKPAVAFE